MNKLAFALAGAMTFALAVPVTPASASFEGPEAQMTAMSAAEQARDDMLQTFGDKQLKPGQYIWRDDAGNVRTTSCFSSDSDLNRQFQASRS